MAETWSENGVEHTLIYIYDESGSPIGLKYRTNAYDYEVFDSFFFEKNLQGDVVAIYNQNGTKIGQYQYDAWGNYKRTIVSGATDLERSIINTYNPFRYRGYYYDVETGWYYLQTRYYNPTWGRFLNADGYLNANGDILGHNMYAYCSNNPVMYGDDTGEFLDFICDVVSVVVSVIDVVREPSNVWNWFALAGDVLDVVIPCVGGLGETVKAVSTANKIADGVDDAYDTYKAIDNVGDTMDAAVKAKRIETLATTGTPNQMGKVGEFLAGIDPTVKKTPILVNGRTRIPDALTPSVLKEVKNVKYISNTQQLRDFAQYAQSTGRTMELWVRPTTIVSQSVIDAGWQIHKLW